MIEKWRIDLDTAIQKATVAAGGIYVDLSSSIGPTHRLCMKQSWLVDPEVANVVPLTLRGFHPTATGQSHIASTIDAAIRKGATLAIASTSLPSATVGTAYMTRLTATGGFNPYSWTITSGTLPAGLALDPASGWITGTPTGSGQSSFTVQATDADGFTATASETIQVNSSGPSTWTVTTLSHGVSSVDCPAAGWCAAFGGVFAEMLAGGVWTTTNVSLPPDPLTITSAGVKAVACPAVGSCVAVGSYGDASSDHGLVETLSGGAWTATEAPLPPDGGNGMVALQGVSCPSIDACTAVGSYTDAQGQEQGLIETLSNGTWSATAAPLPGDATSISLAAVACTSAGSCTAVGAINNGATEAGGVVETLAGGSWGPLEPPLPANATLGGPLSFIACPSAGFCVAAGTYGAGSMEAIVLETLAGGTWAATQGPLPPDATQAEPTDISCPAIASCVVVGFYEGLSPTLAQGLIETLSGAGWTAVTPPVPPGFIGGILDSVACPSPSTCVAAGPYVDGHSEGGFPVIDTLSGGAWTAVEAPQPANELFLDGRDAMSVACALPAACIVAGDYTNNHGADQGFALQHS